MVYTSLEYEKRKKGMSRRSVMARRRRRRNRCIALALISLVVVLCVLVRNEVLRNIGKGQTVNLKEQIEEIFGSADDNGGENADDGVAVEEVGSSSPMEQTYNSQGSQYVQNSMQERTLDEIYSELENLARQYGEFQAVYDNRFAYPEDVLAALCNNPDMIGFVNGYLTSDGQPQGGLTDDELAQSIPLLIQYDQRWGYVPFGDDNIALSGCAPTCLSMVITGLTGNADATPYALAQFAEENGYYLKGTGTMWSIMTDGCRRFGVRGRVISLDKSTVFKQLEAGHPIICSMRPGDFTMTGHFIVLAGVEDGQIRVNDPNSSARSSRLWDYETLEGQIKNLWAFQKKR